MELLRQSFRPEFLNRIDEIIVFRSLTKSSSIQITRLLLDQVAADCGPRASSRSSPTRQSPTWERGLRPRVRRETSAARHSAAGRGRALADVARGELEPGDRVRVDQRDGRLNVDIDKGAAEAMEEVEEPESQPARVGQ